MRCITGYNFRKCYLLPACWVVLMLFALSPNQSKAQGIHKVVLDAGHGGHDSGNLGTGRYKDKEKDIALKVILKLGEYINQNFPDVEVVYTRDKDVFIPLHKRSEIANKAGADLFISIHCNAAASTQAYGTETFVMGFKYEQKNLELTVRENKVVYLEDNYEENYEGLDPENPESNMIAALYQNAYQGQSIKFANMVENQFSQRVSRRSRGVKQAVLFVMNRTTMPSVLIELGFLTNSAEEDFLNSDLGQVYMASAVYRAFKSYKEEVEGVDLSTRQTKVKPTEKPVLEEEKPRAEDIQFKIQLLSSSKKLENTHPDFKGINEVEAIKVDELYKYTVGSFSSYNDAKKELKKIKDKGFGSAFIIAVKNGNLMALKDAIKQSNKK